MGARAKSGTVRGAAHKPASKPPPGQGRSTAHESDLWEPQLPDERYEQIDRLRIVQGDGRSLPLYSEDYD